MSQKTIHTMPPDPATTKAPRQLTRDTRNGTTSGTTMFPTFAPELNIPVAVVRSRLGNHSATVLMHAGKLAASPRPSRNMATPKVITENAAPGSMAAQAVDERKDILRRSCGAGPEQANHIGCGRSPVRLVLPLRVDPKGLADVLLMETQHPTPLRAPVEALQDEDIPG